MDDRTKRASKEFVGQGAATLMWLCIRLCRPPVHTACARRHTLTRWSFVPSATKARASAVCPRHYGGVFQ